MARFGIAVSTWENRVEDLLRSYTTADASGGGVSAVAIPPGCGDHVIFTLPGTGCTVMQFRLSDSISRVELRYVAERTTTQKWCAAWR